MAPSPLSQPAKSPMLILFLIVVFVLSSVVADVPYGLVGRSLDSSEGVKLGWPGSGLAFVVAPQEEVVDVAVALSLSPIKWYDLEGQMSDGVRVAVFIEGEFQDSHLVKPSETPTDVKISVPSAGGR